MTDLKLTATEWAERIKDNAVYRSMRAVNELAAQIADGRRNSAIVSGPAGVGKTWAFEEAFKANRIKFQCPRVSSPQALIEALSLDPKGTFLFDECDTMLQDVALLNILKIATDSKLGPRILEYKTRKEESTIDPFEFKGKIVFLMNTDLHKAARGKFGPHISALMDRCEPYIMTFDHFAIWEYTCYLAICERMLMRENINREITNQALRFFTETMWRRNSVSPRALTLVARSMKRSPSMWRELLEPTLLREPFSDAPVPPIPQLPDPVKKDSRPVVLDDGEGPRQWTDSEKKILEELRQEGRLADPRPASVRAIDEMIQRDARRAKKPTSALQAFRDKLTQPKAKKVNPIVKKTADEVERRVDAAKKPMSKEKAEMNEPVLSPVRTDWTEMLGDLPSKPRKASDDLEDAEPASHVLQ